MDITSLNTKLKDMAVMNGLCQQWQDEWLPETDIEGLMEKFLRGIDFYLVNRFIPKDKMLTWFTPEDRHRHNIVIDERRSILNPRCGLAVGNTDIIIRCNSHSVCNFYATDNSHVDIKMHNKSHLFITLCDNAIIHSIQCDPEAHIFISRTSVDAKVDVDIADFDNIRQHDNFNLYAPKQPQ